jgi:acyl-CoA dehydrogenase
MACAVAAEYAQVVDIEGRFPIEAFSALKQSRLMGAFIPSEFGGEGATLSEVASICHSLARNCGSTGLIYAMHLIQTACIARHGRTNAWQREVLRKAADEQLLLASATTELATGGNLGSSACAIQLNGNHFTMEKQGAVISYGDQADMLLVTARRSPDARPSDQVLAVIARQQFQLTQTGDWDTLGMRGTCSKTFLLRAEGHADQILPAYGDIQNDTMTPVAHLTWSSVWHGIALEALSRARRYVRANPDARAAQARFVDANAMLQQMRADILEALRLYEGVLASPDRPVSLSLLMTMNNLKMSVSAGVVQVIQQALMICGIGGYRNDSPYSVARHLRDALSAPLMVSNDRIAASMGKMLMVQRGDVDLLSFGNRN